MDLEKITEKVYERALKRQLAESYLTDEDKVSWNIPYESLEECEKEMYRKWVKDVLDVVEEIKMEE